MKKMKGKTNLTAAVLALLMALSLAGCKSPSGPDSAGGEPVAVTGVTLNHSSLNLIAGRTATLTATVAPNDATNKTVTWSSSSEAAATVANGVVTAVAEGTATITVTTADGGKTDTCAVTVVAALPPGSVYVSAITLDHTTLTLAAGDTATLTPAITPDDATNKAVTWETSDAAVATVVNGVVTAVAEGTATITVSAVYGIDENVNATCAVTVTPPAPPGSAEITITIGNTDAGIDGSHITAGVLTLSRSSEPVTLTLANSDQYDAGSIRWRVQNTAISGSGATFELDASSPVYLAGKSYFVTVEALKGGAPYDYTITFKVEE